MKEICIRAFGVALLLGLSRDVHPASLESSKAILGLIPCHRISDKWCQQCGLTSRENWFPIFKSYGVRFDRLPSDALNWLSKHGIGTVSDGSWRLLAPLRTSERTQFDEWLVGSDLNSDSHEISTMVQQLTALGLCRHCGHSGIC